MRYYYFQDPYLVRGSLIGVDVGVEYAFMLVVDKVPDLVSWKEQFNIPGSFIRTTFGKTISLEDMESIITLRSNQGNRLVGLVGSDFYTGNHNLIHRKVPGYWDVFRCVGNDDCYDLYRSGA